MNRSGSYWGIYTNLQSPNQNISYKVIEQQQKTVGKEKKGKGGGGIRMKTWKDHHEEH